MTEALYRRFRFHMDPQSVIPATESYFNLADDEIRGAAIRLGQDTASSLKLLTAEKDRQLAIARLHCDAETKLPSIQAAYHQANEDFRNILEYSALINPLVDSQLVEAARAAQEFYGRQIAWSVVTILVTNSQLPLAAGDSHLRTEKLAVELGLEDIPRWLKSNLSSDNQNDALHAQKLKDLGLF